MPEHRSIADHLRERVAEAGDRPAIVRVMPDPDGGERLRSEPVSYAELDRRAGGLAAVLQDRAAAGDRVLVVQSCPVLFVTSLLACWYAGAVPVPVPAPGGRRHHDERLVGIVRDTAAVCAVADAASAGEVSQLLARAGYGGVTCLAADEVRAAGSGRPTGPGRDRLALLQYTSGTTRDPRGVMITHDNLLANQAAIQRALGTRAGSRLGGWLPLYHDMGLVGQLLHPLWLGATLLLLSPREFVAEPVRWLRMISEFGVTVSGASDFGYDLCCRRVSDAQLATLDLAGWETAVTGGEPVRPDTVRAFTERFAPTGFRPRALVACYGLAEATLLVSGGATGVPPTLRQVDAATLERDGGLQPARPGQPVRTLVGCGSVAGGEVRIVHPETREPVPAGRVGEIWVRGPAVGAGYWRQPRDSTAVFRAATADGEAGFLRTGDLGALEAGELFVTARIKDVVVVTGRGIHPEDVERAVRGCAPGFAASAVFGVSGEREHLVVVQEVTAAAVTRPEGFPGLVDAVHRCVREEFDVAPGGVALVRAGSVRRTTSGKVERAGMRRLFLGGRLQPLHEALCPDVAAAVSGPRRA